MTFKRISIVIPTHQRPELLCRALKSALACCGSVDEIVIVSDHDPTAKETLSDITDPRIRLIENNSRKGASATRNIGVTSARGHTILFLDDDDELQDGYISNVLAAMDKHDASWGFASQLVRSADSDAPQANSKVAIPRGFLRSNVPFRRKLGALSAGFWVRRQLFVSLGGLCEDQLVDEDVDLCCRLIADEHEPWFEPEPATILDRNSEHPRLTNVIANELKAECYLRSFTQNHKALKNETGATAFLATRAQRMILRSGQNNLLNALLNEEINMPVRALLWCKRVIAAQRSCSVLASGGSDLG